MYPLSNMLAFVVVYAILKIIISYKIIDYTKVPLIVVKRLEHDTLCKTIINACAYD